MIPELLQEKIEAAKEQREHLGPRLPTVKPGELVVAEAPNGTIRRIVAITRLDGAGVCRIQLLTNELEMATDLDMVIDPDDSGFPAKLLAQPELFGPVFKSQLMNLVGRIDDELTHSLIEALRTDGESIPSEKAGFPLSGPDDPRRSFKEDELDDLDELVRECRAWLMGAPAEKQVLDPLAFLPPPVDASEDEMFDAYEELLETMKAVESGEVHPPDLESLFDDEAFAEIRRWEQLFGFRLWEWWLRNCRTSASDDGHFGLNRVAIGELRAEVVRAECSRRQTTLDLLSRRSIAGEVVKHEYTAIRVVAVAA